MSAIPLADLACWLGLDGEDGVQSQTPAEETPDLQDPKKKRVERNRASAAAS